MKKRIITAFLFITITSILLFFYLLDRPAPADKNFTGGETLTSRFIYVSGSQGWNQKVNYRNKYKVALGNMLTTKMEKNIINSIKSDISSITNGKNWPKEGYEIKLSNIRLIDDGYDLSAARNRLLHRNHPVRKLPRTFSLTFYLKNANIIRI